MLRRLPVTPTLGIHPRLETQDSDRSAVIPKPYVSIAELALLTPWTEQAIRSMIRRSDFLEGVHFFKSGRRVVFKWAAVVDFIEHREPAPSPAIPLLRSKRHEPAQA